jgi:hypothetical protein
MGLDVPHRRPIARLAARGAISGAVERDWHAGPYAPPATVVDDGLEHVAADVGDLCVRILRGVLLGEDLSRVQHHLAPHVVTWSPHLFTVSRDQLLTSVGAAQLAGETLSEVMLDVTHISAAQPHVYVEWRLTARFTSPGFIDDDLLIEPTGRLMETAGVEVVTFKSNQVVSVRCYSDDLALLEQLIASR